MNYASRGQHHSAKASSKRDAILPIDSMANRACAVDMCVTGACHAIIAFLGPR